jgi:hypothetical protein
MLAYVFWHQPRRGYPSLERPREDLAGRPLRSGRKPGACHVDAVAAERHALRSQALSLAVALCQRAVGANDSPPGEVGVVALEEDRAGETGGTWRDVAVGADEAGRDLADAGKDFEEAGFRRGRQLAGPKASMMRFWNSESSSGEMK